MQKPSAIPADTLAGRRNDTSRAVRLTTRETLTPERMGEFTLRPQQEAVRAIFVPIARLQRDLDLAGRANVLLLSAADGATADAAAAERLLNEAATFEDLGLRMVRVEAQHAWALESETGTASDALVRDGPEQARRLGFGDVAVLTYLANTIRVGAREMPYSVVAGCRPAAVRHAAAGSVPPRGSARPFQADGPPAAMAQRAGLARRSGRPTTSATRSRGHRVEYYLWSDEAA